MSKYLAIDPGSRSGAWAIIDHNGTFVACGDVPNDDSGVLVGELLEQISLHIVGDDVFVALEKVHSMPGQGVSSMFNFGASYGALKAFLFLRFQEPLLVTPQKWKKHFGLIGTEKSASLDMARHIWPTASLKRKKDNGRADALLIAKYTLDNS